MRFLGLQTIFKVQHGNLILTMNRKYLSVLIVLVLFVLSKSYSQSLEKPQVDDYWHYHDVGNMGMTVTNYGLLGQGYEVALKDQPSCQYKYHSGLEKEQVEHFSYAGLWFGGVGGMNGGQQNLVSTAIVDGVFEYGEAGFEFTNSADANDIVRERSSIVTSPLFDPNSISHQDFICDFTDRHTVCLLYTSPSPRDRS